MPFRDIVRVPGGAWCVKIDPVYRILNRREYVERFFDTGSLQVSTLRKMRGYPDEMMGDPGEGTGMLATTAQNGTTHVFAYDTADNAFVLCTTAHLESEVIKDFGGVGAIKIEDPSKFGATIAAYLPHIGDGVEGHCDYIEHRQNWIDEGTPESEMMSNSKHDNYGTLNTEFRNLSPGTEAFHKPVKYAHQREYRFLWFSRVAVTAPLILDCPEARQYCTPVWL